MNTSCMFVRMCVLWVVGFGECVENGTLKLEGLAKIFLSYIFYFFLYREVFQYCLLLYTFCALLGLAPGASTIVHCTGMRGTTGEVK